jgi:hypothetical protein
LAGICALPDAAFRGSGDVSVIGSTIAVIILTVTVGIVTSWTAGFASIACLPVFAYEFTGVGAFSHTTLGCCGHIIVIRCAVAIVVNSVTIIIGAGSDLAFAFLAKLAIVALSDPTMTYAYAVCSFRARVTANGFIIRFMHAAAIFLLGIAIGV